MMPIGWFRYHIGLGLLTSALISHALIGPKNDIS